MSTTAEASSIHSWNRGIETAMITREMILVTPQQAAEWLTKNTRAGRLQDARTEMIARDICAGRWQRRNVSIAFFIDGTLADGQHRLEAIVLSGIAVECIVEFGYPMDTQFNAASRGPMPIRYACAAVKTAIWRVLRFSRSFGMRATLTTTLLSRTVSSTRFTCGSKV
jgi:hypothetical protein